MLNEHMGADVAANGGPHVEDIDFVHTGPGTLAGRYLRRFWQPVYQSEDLRSEWSIPLKIMGENLTLFRGSSGTAYLIGNRCAHRGTQLSTGIVEGEGIRCAYHGWKYDGAGQCVDQPSEPCSFAERVRIKGYPTREYLGLVFAYMGQGEPPPMPRYPHFEADGAVVSHRLVWPFNYFQHLENAIDEVHIGFLHASSPYQNTAYAAKAAPDGYTLFFSIDTPFVVNVVVSSDLPYRVSDFAPISLWSINPFLLLVNSKLHATSLPELLTLLRANPGKYNASSASATTLLAHELLKSLANVEYAVIPYKGGAEAIVSVASGETQLAFYDLGNARAMIESGAVRPLAQTPLQRSAALPDIPTLAESGVPGFEAGTWGALFAPAQTPQHIVDKINADVRKIIAMPEIVEKLRGLGVEPRTSSPEELSTMIAESTAKWSVLVKQRNIKIAR